MHVRVECYAGYKGAESPRRFVLGEREFTVMEIIDRWYGPDDACFRVRTRDGRVCLLRHTPGRGDDWSLEPGVGGAPEL